MNPHHRHICLDDLSEEHRQIVEAIGLENFMRLAELRGGSPLYLPTVRCLSIPARNRAIRDEFDGRNHADLARRYGLTVSWIRTILSGGDGPEKPAAAEKQKQLALF
jgi:Mor family transcriptional regulator